MWRRGKVHIWEPAINNIYVHLSFFACHFRTFSWTISRRISPKNYQINKKNVEKCVDLFSFIFRRISLIISQFLLKHYGGMRRIFYSVPHENVRNQPILARKKNKWTCAKLLLVLFSWCRWFLITLKINLDPKDCDKSNFFGGFWTLSLRILICFCEHFYKINSLFFFTIP